MDQVGEQYLDGGRRARKVSAVVCTPQPPRSPSLPSASGIFTPRLFAPHALDSSPDHRVRLGPSEVHRHLLLRLLLAHYLWVRETAEARPVLAWRGPSAGRCCAKARMHPAGDGDGGSASMRPDNESAACACAVAVRHGAAGQAPLAVSQTRVPCSLDRLRCWCEVACAPGCDHPLSEDEAEVSPSQPTAAPAGRWSARGDGAP